MALRSEHLVLLSVPVFGLASIGALHKYLETGGAGTLQDSVILGVLALAAALTYRDQRKILG